MHARYLGDVTWRGCHFFRSSKGTGPNGFAPMQCPAYRSPPLDCPVRSLTRQLPDCRQRWGLPALARQIEELASRDESFDDLCEDLAVAELALTNLRQQPEPISKQQLSEYEGWMVSLTAEIEDAVGRAGTFQRNWGVQRPRK
jgi:hypothetical protein